jgi:hypothetical protein
MTDERPRKQAVLTSNPTDRPIERPEEDLLDRGPFVDGLVKLLCRPTSDESVLIGICGPWGSGKTSLRNLILSKLKSEQGSPTLVPFTPWVLHGPEQIVEALLQCLMDEIAPVGEVREVFRKLARQALAFGVGVAKTGGIFGAAYGAPDVSTVSATMASGLEVARTALADAVPIEAVDRLKRRLDTLLRDQPRRFLVLIDEIDRLQPEEIQRLFQAIKAVADFPKVVYLLFYQREVVEKSLETRGIVNGRDYLEKLIPIVVDVPWVATTTLVELLEVAVKDQLSRIVSQPARYETRLAEFAKQIVGSYVTSLRGLKRLLVTFDFYMTLLTREAEPEVDPIDLLSLEALRLFEPGVFSLLPIHRELLLTPPSQKLSSLVGGAEGPVAELVEKAILSKARHAATSKAILAALFPVVAKALKVFSHRDDGADIRSYRVGVTQYFDRYFLLRLGAEDLPRVSLLRIIRLATSRDEVVKELKAIPPGFPRSFVMHQLRHWSREIPATSRAEFIAGIFEFIEDIPGASPFPTSRNFEFNAAAGLIVEVLRLEEPTRRSQTLRQVFEKTGAFYLGTILLDREKAVQECEQVLTAADRAALLAELQKRVITATRDGRLLTSGKCLSLVMWWRTDGDRELQESWLHGLTASEFKVLCQRLLEEWPPMLGVRGADGTARGRNLLDILDTAFGESAVSTKIEALCESDPSDDNAEALREERRARLQAGLEKDAPTD